MRHTFSCMLMRLNFHFFCNYWICIRFLRHTEPPLFPLAILHFPHSLSFVLPQKHQHACTPTLTQIFNIHPPPPSFILFIGSVRGFFFFNSLPSHLQYSFRNFGPHSSILNQLQAARGARGPFASRLSPHMLTPGSVCAGKGGSQSSPSKSC